MLKENYSCLNEKEMQLCCMMIAGFKTEEIAAVPKPNATVNKRTASRDFCISSSNFLLLFLPIRFDILGT